MRGKLAGNKTDQKRKRLMDMDNSVVIGGGGGGVGGGREYKVTKW